MTDNRKKYMRDGFKTDKIVDPMESSIELKAILNSSFIDLENKEYNEPPAFLSIRADNGKYTTVFSPSDISAITGKAKAKKTFVQSMLISAVVKNGELYNTIKADLPKEKETVVLLDTEQSEYHVSRVINRINKMSGKNKQNLKGYSLRGLDAEVIIKLINYIVDNTENLGMIFIDQVADLAKSINSEEEAVSIVKVLERITKEKDIHICCVIHQNKADNYASGWLGSQIMKKSQTVISVSVTEDDKSISTVKSDLSRSLEFKEFDISINEEGIPYVVDAVMFSSEYNHTEPEIMPKIPYKENNLDFPEEPPF